MQDLVIIGTGGVGRMALQIAQDMNERAPAWQVLGFLDDNPQAHGAQIGGLGVLGGIGWLAAHPTAAVAIGVGQPAARRRIAARLRDSAGDPALATLIHPLAWLARRVTLGPGAIVYPGVLIDADVTLGALAILNKACTIGHDAHIGACVTIAPGVNIGGAVRIGDGCDIGIGSATVQGISIGAWSIVGAGAAVIADLPANTTAVGVPARVIKTRSAGWHE
jgi:sugar O-acyltransferase (sialic acid O-acetyltransferase NeuD family)